MKFLKLQQGFISYLQLAIVLLAVFSVASAQMIRSGNTEQYIFSTRTAIIDQAELIRSRIFFCTINFPAGDNGTGIRPRFPATPTSNNVRDAICPGSASNLWTASSSIILPSPPAGFSEWQYQNDGAGLRISISASSATNTTSMKALRMASTRLSNATLSNSTLSILVMP